ncbi:hypothetical protein MBAV_003910 [Candidatus Magnetobacterium bavaricum]|uniref:Uncharacterized protein n=1 Tax=Candidatus Magnetobacterium bavaricum TaxID=29290 RepID=A0A0F3GPT3_9BACT|nr:hypothetical protein MBAV_003910 [Candidatus Magnetobacterium bavaricum]
MISLSSPRASPPWGGAPYFRASSRKPNRSTASSALIPIRAKTLCWRSALWIRMLPPPISLPLRTMS